MGADGGTDLRARKLSVATKKVVRNSESSAGAEARLQAARRCALSGHVLQEPMCCDSNGDLFNYEEVLTAIVDQRELPARFSHLTSRSAVLKLQGTTNPAYQTFLDLNNTAALGPAPLICPITSVELGASAFVAFWTCGHVVSKEAVGSSTHTCPVCEEHSVRVIPLLSGRQGVQSAARTRPVQTVTSGKDRRLKRLNRRLEKK